MLLHKLSDGMHLYLDSIKKNNELCQVISDTGQEFCKKALFMGASPIWLRDHHLLAPNKFRKEIRLWTPCQVPRVISRLRTSHDKR